MGVLRECDGGAVGGGVGAASYGDDGGAGHRGRGDVVGPQGCEVGRCRGGADADLSAAGAGAGHRDILGLWIGDGGEVARQAPGVLTGIKNHGAAEVLMLVCDGLTGLPDAVNTIWPATIVQTCVVHLLRNSFRYTARQDWEKIAKALRPVYTAPTEEAALERLVEFTDAWSGKYPAIVQLWEAAWAEFVPFLRFDFEIRKIVCTTNAIESINARIRKAVLARGHFPPTRPLSNASTWPS